MPYKPLIRSGEVKEQDRLRAVGFHELLETERELKDQFLHYQSNGQVPIPREPPKKTPEVPQEELDRRRLEQLERETFRRAFAAGEQAGLAAAQQRLVAPMARLEALLHQLEGLPARIFAEISLYSEHLLVETAIVVLRELFHHELSVNPVLLAARVRRLLDQAVGREVSTLSLNPEDVELLSGIPEFQHLRLQADPALTPGTVVLTTDFGGIEDPLREQLQQVEEAVRAHLQGRLDEAQESGGV